MTTNTLSPKKQEILDFVLSFTREHGFPPSVREIAAAVNLKSPSTVHAHIKSLEDAGYIFVNKGKTRAMSISATLKERHNRIPLVGNVAAGSPILAEENIEEYVLFDNDQGTKNVFALRVRGESMVSVGIFPGDIIVVKPVNQVQNGDIVVALFESEATVKTYRVENGHIWLYPENPSPEYQPIAGDNCEIVGRVTAVIRKYA